MKTALIFIAYERPDYFSQVIGEWKKQPLNDIDIYVNLEMAEDHTIFKEMLTLSSDIVTHFGSDIRNIQINNPKLGLHYNHFNAMDRLFKQGYDFVIQVEEDILPANDAIFYMKEMATMFADDSSVFCVGGFQYTHDELSEKHNASVHTKHFFNPWLWGTWKDRWENYMVPNWCFKDFDANLSRLSVNKNWLTVFPSRSRSQNIGYYGYHQNEETDKSFINTNVLDRYYDVTEFKFVDYRLLDIKQEK